MKQPILASCCILTVLLLTAGLPARAASEQMEIPERYRLFFNQEHLADGVLALTESLLLKSNSIRQNDVLGLRASGKLTGVAPKVMPQQDADAPPKPDVNALFTSAVGSLTVNLVSREERWIVVDNREIFVGDTLELEFQGERIFAKLTGVDTDFVEFTSLNGQKLRLPLGTELSLDQGGQPNREETLESLPGLEKQKKR